MIETRGTMTVTPKRRREGEGEESTRVVEGGGHVVGVLKSVIDIAGAINIPRKRRVIGENVAEVATAPALTAIVTVVAAAVVVEEIKCVFSVHIA
jgi:hypothetical protein